MKDSGLKWVGQIPADWEVTRFKYVITASRKGAGITKEQVYDGGEIPCVRYGEIYSRYDYTCECCFSKTKREYLSDPVYVHKGDILFACTGELIEEIGKNILYLADEPCVAGGDIYVVSHRQHPSYLNYYLSCHSTQAQKSYGKHKLKVVHLKSSDIENLVVFLPPLPEQRAIAAKLDALTSRIESESKKITAEIARLDAYKKSVITEVVCRGLDPKVKMKDSGIPWIGKIPEGWRVSPLKHYIDILSGYAFPSHDFGENGIRLLRGVNVGVGVLRWDETVFWNRSTEGLKEYLLKEGDLIIGLDRPWIGTGTRVAFVKKEDLPALLLQRVCRIRSSRNIGLRLVYYWLLSRAFQNSLEGTTTGISVPHISPFQVGNFKIAIPPLAEQRKIAAYIDATCARVDAIIVKRKRQLDRLDALKRSLVYEYVTGKKVACEAVSANISARSDGRSVIIPS